VIDDLSVGTREALSRVSDFVEIGPQEKRASGVQLVEADVRDAEATLAAIRGSDVLVHLAANTGVPQSVENPRSDGEINVLGTLNCLEAARLNGVPRFVFASSGAPVGNVEPPIHEELPCHPISPYGASKLAGEAYCSAYHAAFAIDTVALRFGNVYGPGSGHKTSVVAKFIRSALAGEPLEIYGDGTQTRDYVFVDDLLDAILRAASADDVGGEVFQIATHRETTVGELAEVLCAVLREHGVDPPEVRHGEPRPGDVTRNFSDITKAQTILGWEPQTELADGLDRTVRAFVRGDAAK
jgi:UDP-glucose 4-epimerase